MDESWKISSKLIHNHFLLLSGLPDPSKLVTYLVLLPNQIYMIQMVILEVFDLDFVISPVVVKIDEYKKISQLEKKSRTNDYISQMIRYDFRIFRLVEYSNIDRYLSDHVM